MIADDERCSHGRGQGGWRFRADGDVEAFIEDDLRTGPWIFGTFLPFSLGGIAVGRGREGRGEAGRGGADRKNWRVLLASRPWRLPRRTTHIVASRKGRSRKIARGGKRDREKERQRGRIEMQKEGRRDDVRDKEGSGRKRKRQTTVAWS